MHLLIHLPIEANEHRRCLWRPDLAGFDSTSIFEGALVEQYSRPAGLGASSNLATFHAIDCKLSAFAHRLSPASAVKTAKRPLIMSGRDPQHENS
jgi:hypothetical protein